MSAQARSVPLVALAGTLLFFGFVWDGALPRLPEERIVAAANAFVNTLGPAERERALFAFDDTERFDWHFVPRQRNGLPLKAMTPDQRTAAHALLQSVMSSGGYLKANGVMQLEGILGVLENRPERRDPEQYFFSIFGAPSLETPWAWRFEGHHISINFTSVSNDVTVTTPAFMGANPATVPSGPWAGWRLLGAEEDLARALVLDLDRAQRAKAVIAATAPRDIITGNDRRAQLDGFAGLPVSEMNEAQRDRLVRIIDEYVGNAAPEIAAARWNAIRDAGVANLYFAWAGSLAPGQGHYYRIHGPTVLFEYDNTQGDANHVHSVWRDLTNDFGEDLLRRHYDEADHQHRD